MKGQQIKPGTEISTGNSGVRIVVGEIGGNGVMYWFGVNSTGTINFDSTMMKPVLKSGALYIEPGSGGAEVHFTQPDIVATVSGSRMIVELKGNEILVYCFEGKCGLQVGLDAKIIPVMNFISYDIVTKQWTPSSGASEMSYDQQWSWNVSCGYCMAAVVPSPTPTITPVRLQSGEPTKKPQNNDVNPGGTP
ncbi:MAG: hypothetical protein IPN29_02415 [Saprospiraceae bacterium]|nr:hypothetical protein [Saprospiraceae bacterium]